MKPKSIAALTACSSRQAAFLLATAAMTLSASAATFTWDGGGANAVTTTAANWVGDSNPATGSDLQFGAAGVSGTTLNFAGANINSWMFNAGASAYTIATSLQQMQFVAAGNAIVNDSSNAQTFVAKVDVFFSGTKTFAANTAALNFANIGFRADSMAAGQTNTLALGGSIGGTISGVISQTGSFTQLVTGLSNALTKTGTGTWILSGANTFTGKTTISAGSLVLGSGGTTGSLAAGATAAIVNNGNLTINRSNAVTQGTDFSTAAITGTGSLTQAGTGTTTLNVANSFSGGLTISNGTLALNRTLGNFTTANALTFSGTSRFNMTNPGGVGAQALTLGALTFSAGDGIVQTARDVAQDQKITFASLATRGVGATGNFINAGTNSATNGFVFTTAPTAGAIIDRGLFYNGSAYATYDSGGFVRGFNYASDTNATTATGAQSSLALAATTNAQYIGSAQATTTSGAISGTQTATLAVTDGTKFTVGQSLSGTNIPSQAYITAIAGNTLTLSTNIGATAVAAGTVITPYNFVSAQAGGTLNTLNLSGAGASMTLAASQTLAVGGILRSGGSTVTSVITGGTAVTAATAGGELVVRADVANDTLVFNTPVTNNTSASSFTKTGAGLVNLLNTGTNYTGATRINAGTLRFNKTTTAAGSITSTSSISVAPGGTLQLNLASGSDNTISAPLTLSGNGVSTSYSLEFPTGNSQTNNITGGITLVGGATIRTFGLINTYNFNTVKITGDAMTPGLTFRSDGANTAGQPHTYNINVAADYTGNTTLHASSQQGILKIGVANALPITTSLQLTGGNNVNNSATLDLNGLSQTLAGLTATLGTGGARVINTSATASTLTLSNTATTFSGVLGGTGTNNNNFALTKSSAGTFTLSGTNTYTGATTIDEGGTLVLGSGGTTGSLSTSSVITNNGTLTINRSNAVVQGTDFNGAAITGIASFGQSGAGTTTLNAANTYTGATLVNAGTLKAGVASVAGVSGAFGLNSAVTLANIAGATLDITGFDTQVGSIAGGGPLGGNITLDAATLTTGANDTNTSYAGIISGASGAVTKIGLGTQSLSGANTYGGATTVSAGALSLLNTGAKSSSSAFTVASGATLGLGVRPASNPFTSANVDSLFSGTLAGVTNDATSNVGIDTSGTVGSFTYASSVPSTTRGMNKLGANTLVMSGANTYSGPTIVSAGTLKAGVASVDGTSGAFGLNSAVTLANISNTILDITGFNTQVGSIAGGGTTGGNITLGAATLTTGADGTSTSYAGVISGATGSLTKTGSGTLTLSGANTFTGTTRSNAGTLLLTNASAIASSTVDMNSEDSGTIGFGPSLNAATFSALTGSRNLSLLNTNDTPARVILSVGNASATSYTYTGVLSGGNLYKVGSGAGTFTLNPGAAVAVSLNSLNASAGGALILQSGNISTAGIDPGLTAYNMGAGARGGTLTVDGANLTVASEGDGRFVIGANAANGIGNLSSGSITADGVVIGHNATATMTQSGGTLTTDSLYHQDGGTATYTLTGGTLIAKTISNNTGGAQTFTLNLNGGTLRAKADTLNLIGSQNTGTQISALLGTGNTQIDTSLSSATIARPLGNMSGQAGTFTKIGVSTLTLSQANTYTGATQVNEGTLSVTGSLGNTAVTVGGASATGTPTLAGGGTIAGATVIAAAGGGVVGTHSPGVAGTANGVGTQAFSSTLDYGTDSIFEWNLASTPTGEADLVDGGSYDKVSAGGAITGGAAIYKVVLSGGAAFTDAFWDTNKSWSDIFTGAGAPVSIAAVFNAFDPTGGLDSTGLVAGRGQFTFNGSSSTLNWTAVPEPTSALAGLLLGAGLLRRRRA